VSAFARFFVLGLVSLTIAACGGDDKKKSGKPGFGDPAPEFNPPPSKPITDAQMVEYSKVIAAKTPMAAAEALWENKVIGLNEDLNFTQFVQGLREPGKCVYSKKPESVNNSTVGTSISGANCGIKAEYSATMNAVARPGSTRERSEIDINMVQTQSASLVKDPANLMPTTEATMAMKMTGYALQESNVIRSTMQLNGTNTMRFKDGRNVSTRLEALLDVNQMSKTTVMQINMFTTYQGVDYVLSMYTKVIEGQPAQTRTVLNGRELSGNPAGPGTGGITLDQSLKEILF